MQNNVRGEILSDWRGKKRTHVNGCSQYSLNIVTIIFVTIASLVSSVAVRSMNTFRVLSVILECSELMMGGMESTVRLAS